MIANLLESAVTFKRCTVEKLAFIILNLLDLGLTLFAVSQGANELNPIMRNMLGSPLQIYTMKLFVPMFLAWSLPGKLLLPAIALLVFVVGWDIRQLVILF